MTYYQLNSSHIQVIPPVSSVTSWQCLQNSVHWWCRRLTIYLELFCNIVLLEPCTSPDQLCPFKVKRKNCDIQWVHTRRPHMSQATSCSIWLKDNFLDKVFWHGQLIPATYWVLWEQYLKIHPESHFLTPCVR